MMFPRQHIAWGKSENIPDAEDNIQLADTGIHTQMSVFRGTQLSWLGLGRLGFHSTMVMFPSSKSEHPSSRAEKEQADTRVQAVAPGLPVCVWGGVVTVSCRSLSRSGEAHTFESHFCCACLLGTQASSVFHPKYYKVVPSARLFSQEDSFL